ncbi:MAG: NUDIX hydrolase [Chloroflexi bacterium]|nr:NUDIX hydrolase [Chloroflexota bacterium]
MSFVSATPRKVHRAVSAGGVVLNGDLGDYAVILISPIHRRIWCLPKGTVEAGETVAQTALREVYEETGVSATITSTLKVISYSFMSAKRTLIDKTVHFFLMRTTDERLRWPQEEILEAHWFPLFEAPQILAYEGERLVVEAAIQKVLQDPQLNPTSERTIAGHSGMDD